MYRRERVKIFRGRVGELCNLLWMVILTYDTYIMGWAGVRVPAPPIYCVWGHGTNVPGETGRPGKMMKVLYENYWVSMQKSWVFPGAQYPSCYRIYIGLGMF